MAASRSEPVTYQLGSRERMPLRALAMDEVRQARITCAEQAPGDLALVLAALGLGAQLEVHVERGVSS